MIGIYKITSPTGKIYVGQSVDIERRLKSYSKMRCKEQIRLYNSLVKYGFSEHIFEVVEECEVVDLNTRERHWQDFYDVLSKDGLNSKLTNTNDKSGVRSEDSLEKQSRSSKIFNKTPEGILAQSKRVESLKALYKTEAGNIATAKRISNTDYAARTKNTDYVAKVANTDYSIFQEKRVANIDWVSKVANTDYNAIAKKRMRPINQYDLNGILIREWASTKEAGELLGISRGNITNCCKGKYKSVKGFVWEYKNK